MPLVGNLVVNPLFLRRGVGLALMHRAVAEYLEWAVACPVLLCDVEKKNIAAKKLYEKVGFQMLLKEKEIERLVYISLPLAEGGIKSS